MTSLERQLRAIRDTRRKALVPYIMGGMTPQWTQHVEAAVHAGADAIEIGVPFSDPMIDGVVIQEAGLRAHAAGATLDTICDELARLRVTVPLIAMTYYNVFHHYGLKRAAGRLHASGVLGAIVPDLPMEESKEWARACADHDVATVLMVAPSTPVERVREIASATQGFAYASARMAVTGQSDGVGDGERVVQWIRAASDVPAFIGIGISTPVQAHSAATLSDGVVVGSALIQTLLDGATPSETEAFIRSFRTALDA